MTLKNTFDFHCLIDSSDHHVDYTPDNIKASVEQFSVIKPELIVMEATGGYQTPLAEALHAGVRKTVQRKQYGRLLICRSCDNRR